jgi:hypothetical protein
MSLYGYTNIIHYPAPDIFCQLVNYDAEHIGYSSTIVVVIQFQV